MASLPDNRSSKNPKDVVPEELHRPVSEKYVAVAFTQWSCLWSDINKVHDVLNELYPLGLKGSHFMMKRDLKTLKLLQTVSRLRKLLTFRERLFIMEKEGWLRAEPRLLGTNPRDQDWPTVKDREHVPCAISEAHKSWLRCAYCFPIPLPWLFQFSYTCLIITKQVTSLIYSSLEQEEPY